MPALTFSTIISRSNCAKTARIPAISRAGQVELLGEENERHLARLEIIKRHQQICGRPSPAIELPNRYDVDLSGSRQAHNPLSAGAIILFAALGLLALGDGPPAAEPGILTHRIEPHRDRMLISG